MIDFEQVHERLTLHRRLIAYAVYGLLAAAGYAVAFLLRFDFGLSSAQLTALLLTLPVVAVVRIVFAWLFSLSAGRWRFVGTADLVRLFVTMTAGTGVLLVIRELLPAGLTMPRSVLVIEWALTSYVTAGVWFAYRIGFERLRRSRRLSGDEPQKRALIVGAGEAGNMLAREMKRFPTGYQLVGFIDDDATKWGCRIQGTEVLGGADDLGELVVDRDIEEVILAVPSAAPEELRRLVKAVEVTGVPLKILPGIAEVLAGQVGLNQVRELQIEDLLGRKPITLELPELAEDLGGRRVLITGAAGSIGSELARQVARHQPRRLVLLDQAETDLFYLELELREQHPDLDIVPVVGDIVDRAAVERVFDSHLPERVFHAAAYKHVPLMETNAKEAVKNNVMGTRVLADAAGRFGAGRFVLVSTDKAVRPANIMGSTKRLAELVVLDYQDRFPDTSYGAVRFGNVLGSKGSVIPIFKRQLAEGKPLTVTHPDATRYFMTIPEAAQLILQASLLPDLRGRIAMLDMGDPVKITELAFNFLRLSGIPAREGESYEFIGLRPGEKIHEELSAPHEGVTDTEIPKVRLLSTSGDDARLADMDGLLSRWDYYLSNGGSDHVEYELRLLFSNLEEIPQPEPAVASMQA